jgi:predicted acetyltransferase
LIEEEKKIVPENELYLHCNIDNPASLRVMIKNGGVIHHKDQSGYYVRIKLPFSG